MAICTNCGEKYFGANCTCQSNDFNQAIIKQFDKKKVKSASNYKHKVGYENEQQIAYLIDFEFKDSDHVTIMHDVKFECNGRTAQIDHLIIFQNFIFVVESKYYGGTVTVDNDSWRVEYNNKTHSIPSPVLQNQRHIKVLEDIIEKEDIFPNNRFNPVIMNIVLISNKTVMNGKFPDEVVYADNFKNHLEKTLGKWLKSNILKAIFRKKIMSPAESREGAKKLLKLDTLSKKETKVIDTKLKVPAPEKCNKEKAPLEVKTEPAQIDKVVKTDLLEALKKLRKDIAKTEKLKFTHHVFSNKTLDEMVLLKPKNKEEMIKIYGVGEIKYEKYGQKFIDIILRHQL